MPKYVLNGKTYNIPDNLTQKFESENPNATVSYTAGGKHYNIPVSKREKFLKAFPDASTGEQPKKDEVQEQKPAQPPTQAEAQPQSTQPTQPAAQPQKQAGPYKPTWQEQMAFGGAINSAQYTAENATKGVEQQQSSLKQMSPVGDGVSGIGNNKNLRKGKQTFDAEKGAFVETYLTSDGREFRDAQQANQAQHELDNNMEVLRYQDMMKQLGLGDLSVEKDKPIDERLKEAYAERMELERQLSEIAKRETAGRKGPRFPSAVGGPSTTYTMSSESKNMESALRLLERRITALEAERDDEGQSMFWRGTADTLKDPSAYTLGLSDLADSGVMAQLKQKMDATNGDVSKLTDSEKALVRNYMMNQEAQQLNERRGKMYGFGQMFGQSLPFMAEFYLTGGFAGLGSAGTRLGTKAGLKMAGSELGQQLTKNLGGRILLKSGQSLLKGTGRVGGALAGGALQSNTIGAAKTYSDIINRNIGTLTINDKGNLDFKDGESIAESFLKGQLTNAFENGSELLGPAFDFAPNYLARVIKNRVADGAVNKLLSNKVWRGTNKVLQKFGVQGLFGEGMEEEANGIANALIGESNWFKDPNDPNKPAFFDGEEQFKTWAGVALTGAVLRGPALAVGGYQQGQYYANKYNLNASDNRMLTTLGDSERYRSVKAMLDGATNENIGSVLNSIVQSGQLSNEEKEAVVFYAQDLVKLRGFNIGSVVAEAVGAQPEPRVSGYNVRGNVVEEVDSDGNVLSTHEYEDIDAMKAGLYELQQQRFDKNLQSDISIMQVRPGNQYDDLLIQYCADNGIDYQDFEEVLSKPSMERSEQEQELVAPFAQLLHDAVYDNTILHEEQSRQDGEEIADADSIDLENGNEQGVALLSAWQSAQQARNELFGRNEELREEVERMESQRLSHQEILSNLETFRPEDRNVIIDYYNQQARYESYMNRKAEKIDEEARNSRERHAFKGTINGQADLGNVYTISDGTNEYYLVSGDVTTDPSTGRITGSTSGLIIGMDMDGSFVNIGDASGYSVLPPSMSLDQFEEAERLRLQEQVSATINPSGAVQAEIGPTERDGAELDNAGGEAGADSTGGNEPSAAAPVTTTPAEQPKSAVNIESVTDKNGIKRYENGVSADDAIADIQADGFDVNEVADASIVEAQQTIDKINAKETKTRKDLVDRKNAQDALDYYQALKERAAMLSQQTEEEAANGEENVNNEAQQPTITENVVSSPSRPNVEEQKQERIKALKAELGELFDDDFTKANDVFELVSMWIGRKRNLAWDDVNGKRGLQKELGWTRKIGGDTKFIESLLAKNGEGMGVDEFVHMVWESPENSVNGEKRFDTDEIKNALLELLRSAGSKSDVVDYAVNTRERAAREALEEERKRAEEEAQSQQEAVPPITDEEIARMEANLPFAAPVEGEDIPDSPITQLMKLVQELMQQEGMPPIKLVDTDRMSDSDWIDLASQVYGGAFVDEDTVNEVREYALTTSVIRNEDGSITIFSDSQTPEDVNSKIQTILDYANTIQEEGRNDGRDTIVQRTETEAPQEQEPATPAAEGAAGTEGEGRSESVVDEYLKPRNEQEEKLIADVEAQLKNEIFAQQFEVGRTKEAYDKKRKAESDRATDLFSDDDTRREEGQLFGFDEMPTDRSVEGVERRAQAEREAWEAAKARLEQLQSKAEHDSRVRGALDNERRQTSFDDADPMAAIEQAAQQFRQEEEEKAYGKENKLVSQDRYEELKKRMLQKLRGQLNAGFDPEILAIGTEMAMFHIEAGARKFVDFAERMIADLGDAIRPYLKAIYNGAREMPGMEELRKQMSSVESVSLQDVQKITNNADKSVNEHKEENNEAEKDVSLQRELSEKEKEGRFKFVNGVSKQLAKAAEENGDKPFKSIVDLRKFAQACGMEVDMEGKTDILLQELVEDALVKAARSITQAGWGDPLDRKMFEEICRLYELQPTISQRSSNRIKMQQYSTPLPMAFVADRFIAPKGIVNGQVLEPTAGNGMLVIGISPKQVHVNELDKTRLANLEGQGFKKVTNQDATQPFEGEEQYAAVIANPPFGSAEAKEYDGKMIPGLEEQITLNALEKMRDDGKAVIIIGGNMKYADNGAINSQKAFFTYLYDHYNVKGVVDMDGSLYAKQGTTYPTRMIIIDGRRSEEERAQTKVYPPVKDNAPRKATSFDELFDIVEEINNDNRKTNGNEVLRTSGPVVEPNRSDSQRKTDTKRRAGQSDANGSDEQSGNTRRTGGSTAVRGNEPGRIQQPSGVVSGQNGTGGLSDVSQQPSTANRGGTGTDNRSGSNVGGSGRVQPTGSGTVQTDGRRDKGVEEKRELNSDKLPYRPHNGAFSLESVAPAAMVEAMDKTLAKIEREYGNIDDFVTTELGYDSVEEMHNALAAEQVDSVAMAIWNMKNGEGMVIGDQTGVGKGRQMAALIRWAVRQGKKPIFVTKDADLFSDIYRDLVDIGSGELRPFIFNADVTITDANGRVVHKSLPSTTQKKVLAMNELPDGYDFAILSYPQMNTGDAISQEEAGKVAKEKGERAKKGKAVKAGKPTPKADFLRRISKDNYLLMDESQNAAGSGNTGAYFQSILKDARAVTFASATFAKRPDTMPLYAIRTAISKAKVKANELISMIGKGGVTLQEIMSRAMTGAGQMVRRERDMSDVVTDWKTIDDPETTKKARRDYDNVMQAFNAIIDFQNDWIRPALARKSAEFASMAGTVTERRGTKNAGVDNPPFVNRLYNFSKQLLLSLKVDAVVNEVVKEIEAGHKPVIALENTLESALDEYGIGETIDDPTLFGKLKKGLDATFRYTLKDEDGNESGGELQPHDLGPEGEQAYNDLVELIQESTQGMFISPLDAITEKLEQKGVKVGEISGRKTRAVLNDNGEYEVRKRENTDRKKLARDFNSGDLDCLIINKTGSTGISLHASSRFKDQRQRTMIMAQPLSDINDYMQMIGRIDRTGQVHRGYYINLGLPVPAETRFMMMLANKLKSLNANTTTSQENKDNEVEAPDLLNKYGDQVMIEYLRDNPDVYRKLGEFLKGKSEPGAQTVKAEQLDDYKPKEGDARQITGRVALLSVDEQDAFYDDVTRRYNELIKYLNDTGANDLKITVMPLRARTIAKGVSSEGTAPNSGNPFADNAYVEWVEMDILKKPMKAADVGKTIEQLNPKVEASKVTAKTAAKEKLLDSRLTPRIRQIIDTVERETEEKLSKENERYEAAKQRAEQDIAERTEVINKQEKRTKEQKEEAIKKYADDKRQAVEESHNNIVNKIEANRMRFERVFTMFTVGESVLIPDDLTTDTFIGSTNGIFCGFKAKNEGVTQSTTLAVFCTLDGRRKIEVKVSDSLALARIDRMTQENWDAALQVTLSNWDEQIPTSSRKHGYIMTGNILQAIADSKQGESFVGQLVTFTDDKGNVRDGILMPDKWEPSQLKGSTVPIAARKEVIKTLESKKPIVSSDGRVTLTHYGAHNQWGYYYLEVPKSKKQGGEFYLDKKLLDLVDSGDFFTASGKMRGRVPEANIDDVVDRLGEMGVTLPSYGKVELDAVDDANGDSDKRMITTNDPMEAIKQASDSWRRSAKESESSLSGSSDVSASEKKSVPLERRTLKSYTDRDANYHKGVEEELRELEEEISRLGRGEDAASPGEVGQAFRLPNSGRRVNDLRRQAAKLRAEIARRHQEKQELRKKYNIDAKGNIALSDLRRMFHDLNSNKVLDKLFDKVCDIVEKINTQFRFTDKLDALTGGEAFEFFNTTFFNWDNFTRGRTDQQKAKTILHELIHNIANQLLDRYTRTDLPSSVPELSTSQKKLAKEIFDIYEIVDKAFPENENGEREFYGATNAYEMLSEMANQKFRERLAKIPYREGMNVLQRIVEWFKDLLGSFGLDIHGNTAFDSLNKALEDIIGNYDDEGIREYREILEMPVRQMRAAGLNEDVIDYVERYELNGGGTASLVKDEEIIQEGEHKGEQYSDAYGKKAKKQKKTKKQKPVEGDPMEAIKEAAAKWARSKADREGETPVAHSEKAVYDERLNRVETVFTEAYQDSMIALKTAQNAIAHDKEIPDSQNAYMAENLMHGKNKNEQDLFNKLFRDPLIDTINRIMDATGMNWGDIDRYVYTKSGLERNREFFVRDWLERQRKKQPRSYEDLNDAEQSIFDMYAARIEEDFEDGTIATEEEKEKKLKEALQQAHQEYVNQIEEEYQRIKSERFMDLQIGNSPALGMESFSFADYLGEIDKFIRRTIDGEYVASEHDYSGFRAMFGDEEGKYDEDAIIEELMDTEDNIEAENVTTLWEQLRNCTRYGLERYREAGMRSDEQIDQVEQMFHWYVPMRGFKEDKGEDMYQYFTGKDTAKNYVGGLLKHAKGRGSEANYPISTIFAMTYKAISDCNQNLVNQKFYRLCQANPNDLVVLSDSWARLNETTGEWEEVAPEIGDDMSEDEIREETLRFEEEMQQLAVQDKAKKIKGKEHFDYKPMDKKKQSEHIIDVRINGNPRKMIVTGNPRMAQALNGQLRFENGKNVFSKWNAAIKNMMAALFTSYSPTFALRNMFRDWTHFRMMLGVREGHGYASQANKYYRKSLFKMVGLFKKYREGRLDESNEMERDFKDFMDNGGVTGFVQMQKIDDIQKQMEKLYKQQQAGKTIRLNNKVWDWTLGLIEAVNEGIENNARFATYRASRHYAGRTKARSAYDAKEITVNFNRKGAGGKTAGFKSQRKKVDDAAKAFGVSSQILGEGRIFFNATVQAIATTFKNFQNADGSINGHYVAWWAMKYAIPPFVFGMALPAINKALASAFGDDDDDPYTNLPEWTRRRNLCFYIGNGNFITIPIGQELAAFLTLGDIYAGMTYAPDLKPVDKSWDDEIVGVMNTFSPVDISTKITKGGLMEDPVDEVAGRTFSVLAPLVAVGQNIGWTGRPIYHEDVYPTDEDTPEYQMVYSGTNPVLVNASKLLHEIGGGDDIVRGKFEVNPAIIQYLWEQYTGGPGKVFSNTISIGKDAKDILTGNESDFNIRKVEGLKAFVQQGDDRTEYYRVNAKYRKYKADADKLYDAVKGYEGGAAENPEYVLKLEQISKGEDFVRMQIVREADKQLSKINKAANKAEGADRKELRRLYNQQVKAVVDMLDEVGE